jgi:hypothetical protein
VGRTHRTYGLALDKFDLETRVTFPTMRLDWPNVGASIYLSTPATLV